MSQEKPEDAILKMLSSIPGARVMMSGGGRVFLRGYQGTEDNRYSLSLRVDGDQSMAFSEEYNYLPRADDDGMVYVYALVVPGDQQEPFLRLLLQKCGREAAPEGISLPALILELLTELVQQGQLAVPQPGKRNLHLISSWLTEAGIAHTRPYLAF
jgi:hypothetical protein